MKCLREEGTEVIWSNVLIDDKGVPHWTGNGEEHADKGVNFQGEWFKGKKNADGKEIPISHPNARCTLRCKAIGNYSHKTGESPEGAPVKVVTYSRPRRRHHASGLGRQELGSRRGHRRLASSRPPRRPRSAPPA